MDETRELARQILATIPLVMRSIAAEIRQSEHSMVSAHFRLLWILEHQPWSLSELAEHLSVSLPTMSNSVTILEERGWVRRTRSPEDRRKVMIEISPQGRAVLAEVNQHTEAHVTRIIQTLSAEEREKLFSGMLILREAFMTTSEALCVETFKDKSS